MWTRFMDMHSGGGTKEPPYEYIYIEAPEAEAKVIFYNRFGHNPERVTCTCCGDDYSIKEDETLEQSTGYERGCAWDKDGGYIERPREESYRPKYVALDDYLKRDDILVIRASTIHPSERKGEVPAQGYVWVGE
jgi:hypothetical protein